MKDVIKTNIKGISTTLSVVLLNTPYCLIFSFYLFHFSQAYVEYAQLEQKFDVSVTAEQKNQPFFTRRRCAQCWVRIYAYLVFQGTLI